MQLTAITNQERAQMPLRVPSDLALHGVPEMQIAQEILNAVATVQEVASSLWLVCWKNLEPVLEGFQILEIVEQIVARILIAQDHRSAAVVVPDCVFNHEMGDALGPFQLDKLDSE